MPTVAQILCHKCGALTEATATHGDSSVSACPCGGVRQVVRIVHHRRRSQSVDRGDLELSVQQRADETSLDPERPDR